MKELKPKAAKEPKPPKEPKEPKAPKAKAKSAGGPKRKLPEVGDEPGEKQLETITDGPDGQSNNMQTPRQQFEHKLVDVFWCWSETKLCKGVLVAF